MNSDAMKVVLSPSCWVLGAAPEPPSCDRATSPRILRGGISPTFQSSLPFGPNNSAPARDSKLVSVRAGCALFQRRHFGDDSESAAKDANVLPQPRILRAKSETLSERGRSRGQFRPEDNGNLIECTPLKVRARTPRTKSVEKKEPNFFELPADDSANRRFRAWVPAVNRGRSAPAAVGRPAEASAALPSTTGDMSDQKQERPMTPARISHPAALERDVSSPFGPPSAWAEEAREALQASPQSPRPKTPRRATTPGRSQTPDRPGGLWNSGCRNGAVMGVGSRTAISPKASDGFMSSPPVKRSLSAPRSPVSKLSPACGGSSSPRSALPAGSPDKAQSPTKSSGLSAAQASRISHHSQAPTSCPVPRGRNVTCAVLAQAPPHQTSSLIGTRIRFNADVADAPRSRKHEQASHLTKQVITQDQTLTYGEDQQQEGVAPWHWRGDSPRRQSERARKQSDLKSSLQGAAAMLEAPYATGEEAVQTTPIHPRHLQQGVALEGCLYLENEAMILCKEQMRLRETKSTLSADSLTFPESNEYASALRTLSPAHLRSFSKHLQENNQRVKSSLWQPALAERRRQKNLRELCFARRCEPQYDAQTGRPIRSLSSGAAASKRIALASTIGSHPVAALAATTPSLPAPMSARKSPEPDSASQITKTPATSQGTLTPATHRSGHTTPNPHNSGHNTPKLY